MSENKFNLVFSYASFRFTDIHEGRGGEEGLAWEIVSRLAARGHRCHVFSPRIQLSRQFENIIPHPIEGCDYKDEKRWLARIAKVMRFQRQSRKVIKKLLRKTHFDAIHHIVPAYPGFSSSVANLGVPFIYGPATVKYNRDIESGRRALHPIAAVYSWLKFSSWRSSLSHARTILVEVDYAKKWMPESVQAKTVRLLKAVDVGFFFPLPEKRKDEEPQVLFLAALRKNKGVDVLLRAIPAVSVEFPKVRFVFVGPNKEPEMIRQLTTELEIGAFVEFVGPVTHERTVQYMQNADIYCFPARQDNAPATLSEAIACGLPIITCDVMGIPEVVEDGVNGLLVPPGDSVALSNALIKLLRSKSLRQSMSSANRQKAVTQLDWERYLDTIEGAYANRPFTELRRNL